MAPIPHHVNTPSPPHPVNISLGKVMGLPAIEGYVQTLDDQFKYTKMLREVYAAINGKDVDHPDLQAFFKFKCWL